MARNSRTVAAATFIALTCICYAVYGYTFLFEALPTASFTRHRLMLLAQAYIYHFGRFDVRHNFAPHFLPM